MGTAAVQSRTTLRVQTAAQQTFSLQKHSSDQLMLVSRRTLQWSRTVCMNYN